MPLPSSLPDHSRGSQHAERLSPTSRRSQVGAEIFARHRVGERVKLRAVRVAVYLDARHDRHGHIDAPMEARHAPHVIGAAVFWSRRTQSLAPFDRLLDCRFAWLGVCPASLARNAWRTLFGIAPSFVAERFAHSDARAIARCASSSYSLLSSRDDPRSCASRALVWRNQFSGSAAGGGGPVSGPPGATTGGAFRWSRKIFGVEKDPLHHFIEILRPEKRCDRAACRRARIILSARFQRLAVPSRSRTATAFLSIKDRSRSTHAPTPAA